ncbi:Lysosomal Pro-X carboxypeptidase [Gryllus bimaculatus]|nr:Lysosomal Pro-X carboxypeptidase [Gryllus bimaculatus]
MWGGAVLLLLAVTGAAHGTYRYTESWLTVPVDHFSFSNNATFKMRYLINDTFWQPEINAPIFFYTGNEGDITMFAENTGFLWETASDDFAALIVFAEHRYYGKSLPFGNESFSAMCRFLPNSSYSDKILLTSLFKALSVYTNYTGKTKCLDIQDDASPQLGESGWDFQACTEMVMPICSNDTKSMFEEAEWNFKKYSDSCYQKWKVRPQPDLAIKNYGGKDISAASNIVFSNGLLDPWAGGGVLRNYSDSLVAILIPEGAHHLDLRARNAADPASVIKAREFHKYYIQQWMKQFYRQHKISPY